MKLLMVCLGNICRSPLAEGVLKEKLSENFIVESAGTINIHEGKKPDHRSIAIAKSYDIDISTQKSRHFNVQDFEKYDRIYCMDRNNLKDVLSLAKTQSDREKVFLMIENAEVPDPYWGDIQDFDHVYQLLDKASEKIAIELKNPTQK